MGEGINCVADHITTAHSPLNGNSFFFKSFTAKDYCALYSCSTSMHTFYI